MRKAIMLVAALVATVVLGANVPLGTASAQLAEVPRFSGQRLPDAGVRLELCGRTRLVEDGGVVDSINGKGPCTAVEPGAAAAPLLNFLDGAAVNIWKQDHGL